MADRIKSVPKSLHLNSYFKQANPFRDEMPSSRICPLPSIVNRQKTELSTLADSSTICPQTSQSHLVVDREMAQQITENETRLLRSLQSK